MQRDGDFWFHYVTRDNGQPIAGWATTLEIENAPDFEVFNHYVATFPTSPFVNWVFLSALTPEGRVNVMNRNVTMLRNGVEPKTWELANRGELRGLLRQNFGFDLPQIEHMKVPAIPEWT